MFDSGKVIVGIIIFVIIVTFPFLYQLNQVTSKPPQPQLPQNEKTCVADSKYIKTSHMVLMNNWRDSVVRDNNREYQSQIENNGNYKIFNMSLQNTCMNCHNNKEKFCDSCHNYMGVKPYCWDCHTEPKEK